MRRALAAFLCGLIFGLGLLVSQMSNPAKVLNFLDLAAIASGRWDASLAFVMIGAIPVAAISFLLARKRAKPVLAGEFHFAAEATKFDARLIGGAAIFGIGWGLVGFCPGPAITALGFGRGEAFLFVAAMFAGMLLFNLIDGVYAHRLQSDDDAQGAKYAVE
ncbi:MAG: DUF6691 family protein [Beijerinckiaceae bacterium]